jgi:AbrB family looped-hinge helix DNA binding protein
VKKNKGIEHRLFDVATVGERGQIVIPSKARKLLNIKAGDRLLALEGPMGSSIVFMKMDSINNMLNTATKKLGKLSGNRR